MDPNLLSFHKKLHLPINMEKNLTNYYGIQFILPSDIMINVNSQKWIIMNFVQLFRIVTFVLLMSIVDGANPQEDVCLETKNTLYVPLLVLMDGSMMLNLVLEKYTQVCFLTLPQKLLDLSHLKNPNLNNMLEPYCIIKLQ